MGQCTALRCRPAFCTVLSPACLARVSLSPIFSCEPSEGRGDAALACSSRRVLALPPASSARSLCTHADRAVPFPPGELPLRRRGSAWSDPPCSLWSPSCDGPGNFRYLLPLPLFLLCSPSKSSQLLWKAGIMLTLVYQDEAHTRKWDLPRGPCSWWASLKTLLAPCCWGRL